MPLSALDLALYIGCVVESLHVDYGRPDSPPQLLLEQGKQMNRRVVRLASVGIAVVLIVVAAIVLLLNRPAAGPDAGTAPTETPEQTPLPTVAAPVPASTAKPGRVKSDGSVLIDPFLTAETAGRTDKTQAVDFRDVATGAALQDLEVNAQQMREDGMVQVGSPKLVSATVTGLNEASKPAKATVRVCLDYSSVDIQTTDGTSVKDPKAQQRVASTLVLHQVDGRWLVAKRTYPAKSAC